MHSRILMGHKRFLIKEETELRNYEKHGHQNIKIPVVSTAEREHRSNHYAAHLKLTYCDVLDTRG